MHPSIREMAIKRVEYAHGGYYNKTPAVRYILLGDELRNLNKEHIKEHGSYTKYRQHIGKNRTMPDGIICKRCGSNRGYGRGELKDGTPRYFCADCGGCFANNGKPVGMHHKTEIIQLAKSLFYEYGTGSAVARDINFHFKLPRSLSHGTVNRWAKKWETRVPCGPTITEQVLNCCKSPKKLSDIVSMIDAKKETIQYTLSKLKRRGELISTPTGSAWDEHIWQRNGSDKGRSLILRKGR